MERALESIAPEGWVPMAAAILLDPTAASKKVIAVFLFPRVEEVGPSEQNFDVQEAVHLYHEAHLGPLEDLFEVNGPYPEGINQLALRISTYEYPLCALLAVYFLSATGHMPAKFPTDQWIM